MQPGFLRQPTIERLPNLLAELKAGTTRIPPFQREFVWTGEQRIHLLDSVRKGLPVGSLLAWRTKRSLHCDDILGRYALGLQPEIASPTQYLLDGRQRMTTLFSALAGGLWTRDEIPVPQKECNAPDDSSWAIWFDLDTEDLMLDDSEGDGAPRRLPLDLLLDDFGFDQWLSVHGGSRERYARARALKSAINDYLVPVIPLATDDIEFVTLSFKRVNAGGTPMSEVHMARALSWSEQFDLQEHLVEVHEHLAPSGWREVDDDGILKVLADTCGLDPTSFDVEKLAKKLQADPSLVARAGEHLARAVQVLAGVGFVGPQLLPYQGALTFAARAVRAATGSGHALDEPELKAWIVEVCITERFGNAPPHVQRAMWRELLARLSLEPGTVPNKIRKAQSCKRFSMAWARSRVTAVVLALREPRRPNGMILPDACRELAHRGTDILPMLFARGAEGLPKEFWPERANNRELDELLRGPANRVVCLPEDAPLLRASLLQGDNDLLESHLIEAKTADALQTRSLITFLRRRRDSILVAERAWLRRWVSSKRVTMPND
jgi:hypothetical protein